MMFVEYKQKFLKLQEAITKKLINYTLSELKTYAYQNTIKKMNGQPKTGRKQTQSIHLTKMYLGCRKRPYNSISKRQTTQLKMGKIAEETFYKTRYMKGQQAHEKLFNAIKHQ